MKARSLYCENVAYNILNLEGHLCLYKICHFNLFQEHIIKYTDLGLHILLMLVYCIWQILSTFHNVKTIWQYMKSRCGRYIANIKHIKQYIANSLYVCVGIRAPCIANLQYFCCIWAQLLKTLRVLAVQSRVKTKHAGVQSSQTLYIRSVQKWSQKSCCLAK